MESCPDHHPYSISGRHRFCDRCEALLGHTGKPLLYDIESKIDIFESRQRAWVFRPARALCLSEFSEPEVHPPALLESADVAAIAVLTSYFEGMQHFRLGCTKFPGATGEQFKLGLARVLRVEPTDPRVITYYKYVRNETFHGGMAYGPVKFDSVNAGDPPIRAGAKPGHLLVDVLALLIAIEADFEGYVSELRAGKGTTEFEQCWDAYWNQTDPQQV